MSVKKMVGVLGGMGPSATARFYQLMINKCQEFGVKRNDEYPHIVIYNLPVPDLIHNQNKKKIAIEMVINGLKKLEAFGVDFIVMPCNTIHLYFNLFRRSLRIPMINLIDATVEKVVEGGYRKVGLIGTETTITSNLYQSKLKSRGIKCFTPKNLRRISKVIKKIISGTNTPKDKQFIINEIIRMKGIQAIILGCTELPLIIKQNDVPIPVLNTLDILAESAIKEVFENGGI